MDKLDIIGISFAKNKNPLLYAYLSKSLDVFSPDIYSYYFLVGNISCITCDAYRNSVSLFVCIPLFKALS